MTDDLIYLPLDASSGDAMDALAVGCPLVLRGAAAHWPALRWTPQFLASRYGDHIVDFLHVPSGRRSRRPLAFYLDIAVAERADWYLVDWDFRSNAPDLLNDIDVPAILSIDWLASVPPRQRPDLLWIYMGDAGTYGRVHVDNFGSSAWLAVLTGTKRLFFPPRDRPDLYPSGSDLFGPGRDAALHVCTVVTLGQGDIAYVPAGRQHAAINDSFCLSVTANFIDGINFCDHRGFAIRQWHGKKMLSDQLARLAAMEEGEKRDLLRRHLAIALDRYRTVLVEEQAFLQTARARLDETRA